jgi:hypothetical protein
MLKETVKILYIEINFLEFINEDRRLKHTEDAMPFL